MTIVDATSVALVSSGVEEPGRKREAAREEKDEQEHKGGGNPRGLEEWVLTQIAANKGKIPALGVYSVLMEVW